LTRELAALGASLEITIGETEGLAVLQCEPASLKAALTLALEPLREPAFSQESLDRAKRKLVESLAARDDSLDAMEERAWKRLTRGSHFSTRLPNVESLGRITREDLVQYAGQFLFARNMLLAVSGAFDESGAVPLLEESLAGLRNRDTPLPIPAEPEAAAVPGLYGVDAGRPLTTARIRVGFAGVRRDHGDRVPLQVLLEVLGGRLTASRLDRALRAEKGLTWDPASSFAAGDFYPGSFSLHATTLTPDAPATVKAILDELRSLGERPLHDDAVAAVRQALVDRAAALETSASARAARFALDELARADAEELTRDRARLEALTADECWRAARLWLDPAKAIVLVVGDAKALEGAKAALGAVKPVSGL
jgi:zinc protease